MTKAKRLDLQAIATTLNKLYRDVDLSCGKVRVYHVAEPALWRLSEPRQEAARYVYALRDVEYPDLSSPPPLAEAMGHYPDDELLRKKVWLDNTILSKTSDLIKVQKAKLEMNGESLDMFDFGEDDND